MTTFTGVICRLLIEFSEEEGAVVARSPELQISNHGTTKETAISNLQASLRMFFEVCAEKGNLVKMLRERGVQHEEIQPDETTEVIEIPISLLALENARPSAG